MALGYALAIGLEGAGLLALATGLLLMRIERRAKASGLKRFLSSGHAAAPAQ